MQKHLVWLASYPKSGNTWVRAFLTAYQHGPGVELDINRLDLGQHAASRVLFDRIIGFPASDLIPAEIDRLRPEVYRALSQEVSEPLFLKVHDRWRRSDQGSAVFPAEVSRLAVYIVRNPLAVAPSLANHLGGTVDAAIERMASDAHGLANARDQMHPQLPQPMGAWSSHVASWLEQTEIPVHLLRYEDLCADPSGQFRRLLHAVALEIDPERLAWALEQTRFERLQAAEVASGFRERRIVSPRFFRQGRPDAWRNELTHSQVERILSQHAAWMQRLGYPTDLQPTDVQEETDGAIPSPSRDADPGEYRSAHRAGGQ
jgi:hypothetical protein